MFAGSKDEFGILKNLTPLCIHKRNLMNYWSTYAELAGNNFMSVNYRLLDPKKKDDLELAIREVKRGKPFMKPEGVELEVTNLTSSSQNQLFENYYKQLSQEQSKLVLGQTMTTEQGSSRSQAEVHERTQSEVMASDDKFILDMLNYRFHDYHGLWNLPDGEWIFKEDSSVKLMAELEKDLKLKELGWKFSPEYLSEKYGLPLEDNKEETKEKEDDPTREEEDQN
jgi:phage gp29-like protein